MRNQQAEIHFLAASGCLSARTPAILLTQQKPFKMDDAAAQKQLNNIRSFILMEANEKADEIRMKVRPVSILAMSACLLVWLLLLAD